CVALQLLIPRRRGVVGTVARGLRPCRAWNARERGDCDDFQGASHVVSCQLRVPILRDFRRSAAATPVPTRRSDAGSGTGTATFPLSRETEVAPSTSVGAHEPPSDRKSTR